MKMKLYAPVLLAMLAVSCSKESDDQRKLGNRDANKTEAQIVAEEAKAAVEAVAPIVAAPQTAAASKEAAAAAAISDNAAVTVAAVVKEEAAASVAAEPEASTPVPAPTGTEAVTPPPATTEAENPEVPEEAEAPVERISTGEVVVDQVCKKVFLTLDALNAGATPTVLPTVAEMKACQGVMITSGKGKINSLAKLDVYMEVTKAVGSEEIAVLDADLYAVHMVDPAALALLGDYINASFGLANLYDVYVLTLAEAALNETRGAIARLTAKVNDGTISETEMDNLQTLNLVLPIKLKKVQTVTQQINTLYAFGNITYILAQVTSLKASIEASPAG